MLFDEKSAYCITRAPTYYSLAYTLFVCQRQLHTYFPFGVLMLKHYPDLRVGIVFSFFQNLPNCTSLQLIVENQLKPACKYTIQGGRREGVGLGSVLGLVLGSVYGQFRVSLGSV